MARKTPLRPMGERCFPVAVFSTTERSFERSVPIPLSPSEVGYLPGKSRLVRVCRCLLSHLCKSQQRDATQCKARLAAIVMTKRSNVVCAAFASSVPCRIVSIRDDE
jgi:hypothetical protein